MRLSSIIYTNIRMSDVVHFFKRRAHTLLSMSWLVNRILREDFKAISITFEITHFYRDQRYIQLTNPELQYSDRKAYFG